MHVNDAAVLFMKNKPPVQSHWKYGGWAINSKGSWRIVDTPYTCNYYAPWYGTNSYHITVNIDFNCSYQEGLKWCGTYLKVLIDGATVAGPWTYTKHAEGRLTFTMFDQWVNLAQGNHTIQLWWEIYASSGDRVYFELYNWEVWLTRN